MIGVPGPLTSLPGPPSFQALVQQVEKLRRGLEHVWPRLTPTVRPMPGATGCTSDVTVPPAVTSTPATVTPRPIGIVPRGTWSPDIDYEVNDLVVIYGVGNAGTWISLTSNPAGSPIPSGTGGNWLKIANGFQPDVWG